jgi:hypothetical protein
MSRFPLARATARLLVSLACLLAVLALAGPAAAEDAPAPYNESDAYWSWPGSVLLHIGTTPVGDSSGYVRSDPIYLDCPSACTRPFNPGTTVVLHAYATNGFKFAGWEGAACEGQETSTCTLTITENTIVNATFTGKYVPLPPEVWPGTGGPYTLNVSSAGGSGINLITGPGIECGFIWFDCSETYAAGTEVTLDAVGFIFDTFEGWSDGESDNPYTFTMNSNRSLTANFSGFFMPCPPFC